MYYSSCLDYSPLEMYGKNLSCNIYSLFQGASFINAFDGFYDNKNFNHRMNTMEVIQGKQELR